jgi:hypothetical protein
MSKKIIITGHVNEVVLTAILMDGDKEFGRHNNITLGVKSGKIKADWSIYRELSPESLREFARVLIAVADEADRRLKAIKKDV